MLDLLHRLAVPDPIARRSALLSSLTGMGASFEEEALPVSRYLPVNIRVPLHGDSPHIVIGAHYDAVPGSPGANDNASGVVILLTLLQAHLTAPFLPPIEFVFFDLEEAEMQGSLAYTQHHDMSQIQAMINLDLCGVGDRVLIAEGSRRLHPALTQAIDALIASRNDTLRIQNIPPSDETYFDGMRVPTASISCVPQADVEPFQVMALALEGKAVLDKFPSVFETMHNRSQDRVDVVEADAMKRVYDTTEQLLRLLR